MEDALIAGKVRAIGVSNFLKEDIDNLWESADVKPIVNQILCHISNTPVELIQYCQNKGIVMEAYFPVAHGEALKNENIKAMAEKYGVSIPQLCIRFDWQLGMIVLPTIQGINTSLDSIDYRLSNLEKDMKEVKEAQQIHGQYLFKMYNDIKDLKRYNRKQDYTISENNVYNFEEKENLKLSIDNLKFRVERLEQKKAE